MTKHILFLLVCLTVFTGCKSNYLYWAEGSLACSNCGITSDGLLKITTSSRTNLMYFSIENLNKEPVVIDEQMLAFADNGFVVAGSQWLDGVQKTITRSFTSSNMMTNSNLSRLLGVNNEASSTSVTTAITTETSSLRYIPSGKAIQVNCLDYFNGVYDLIVSNNTTKEKYTKELVIDWTGVERDCIAYRSHVLSLMITYRLLNEKEWHSANITMTTPDFVAMKKEAGK